MRLVPTRSGPPFVALLMTLLCAIALGSALVTSAASAETEREAIVAAAESQDQYHGKVAESPTGSECNPYTAYWGDGTACSNGERSNAWCADFAAWAWKQGGANFTYGFSGSDINAWSASFYFWGLATGNWHPLSSGYSPQPGDVAVYGNLTEAPGPGHVGIYVSGSASSPTVINGNWEPDYQPPARVYEQSGESNTGVSGGVLDGYVSPPGSSGSGGGGREPNGSFIKVTGAPAIYRVIGGAPVHVDSCAPLGGCPGLVEVPSLSGYATVPENGAYMQMADGSQKGLVARVVGGDALGLTTCEGLAGCNEPIALDEAAFNEYVAAHQTIANGTFVRVADGSENGLIGRVVGGVLLGLTSCEGMEGEGCLTLAVNVAENAYNGYAAKYHTIANGTFVRVADGSEKGLIGRVVGGVLIGLTTCEGMESEGCLTAPVNVAENAYNYYASEHHVIANGTFVRVADGNEKGLIGRVVGGVLLGLLTCEGMESEHCQEGVNVAENVYNYYAGEFHTIASGTFVRIADGPKEGLIARAAGGALLGLTSCAPLEECPGQVNVAENAFTYYTAEHPQPANGTLVEGVPSGTYWLFTNGEREPASAGAGAVAIDDGGLAFYPIKAPSSGNPGAGSTGAGTTSTTGASTGSGSTTSSPGKGGVLASHTAKPLTRAQKLAKAIRACDKLRRKRKREACIAAASRRYHQPKSVLPGVIAGWQGGYVVRPPELALTPTDGEYFAGAGGVWPHSQPIDWISWTKTEASGRGALWVDACGCYREGYSPHSGTVRAFDIRDGNFAQLTIKTPYLNGPLKISMSYERGYGGEYRFETGPKPVTDHLTSEGSTVRLAGTTLRRFAVAGFSSLPAPAARAARYAPCDAALLFKAAEVGQHFNTRAGYGGNVRPGASEVVCDAGWAVALISHPNVGQTDGNTLFRSIDGTWRYVGELGGSVATCEMRHYHVPKPIALKLAHGHEHSGIADC